ncbi:unnamed protein product [Amaranthus hypochondriacus]
MAYDPLDCPTMQIVVVIVVVVDVDELVAASVVVPPHYWYALHHHPYPPHHPPPPQNIVVGASVDDANSDDKEFEGVPEADIEENAPRHWENYFAEKRYGICSGIYCQQHHAHCALIDCFHYFEWGETYELPPGQRHYCCYLHHR